MIKYTYYIGIDVSKNTLDFAVMKGKVFLFHKVLPNTQENIKEFINEIKQLSSFALTKALFCMEHTGYYCNSLIAVLKANKTNIVVENAVKIKNSLGLIRDKSDKIDAIRIANYACLNCDKLVLYNHKRSVIIHLSNLVALRSRLLGALLSLKVPLKEEIVFVNKELHTETMKGCSTSIMAIKADIAYVEDKMNILIKSDDHLTKLFDLITTVPGVGQLTAIQILLSTNEFKDISNAKKFACYAGVVPFIKGSGLKIGRGRISQVANKKVKALLHICAITSLRCDKVMKEYYKRKILDGKPPMAVINAIRNKLILRVFACVNRNEPYQKDYVALPLTKEDL